MQSEMILILFLCTYIYMRFLGIWSKVNLLNFVHF